MLTDPYILPTTASFPNASAQNNVLPTLYGDLSENSSAGVTNCPCINNVAHVYAIAGHGILSIAKGNTFRVYEQGILTTKSYQVNTGIALYGSTIATLTFFEAPTDPITIACKGKTDVSGNLITNPVDIILDLLSDDATLDDTAISRARQTATRLNYTCAGAIVQDTTYATLLTQIMSTFLGDWYISGDKELVLSFDATGVNEQVAGFLRRARCDVQSATRRLINVVNQVQVNYAVAFVEIDKRFKKGFRADNYYMTDDGTASKDDNSQQLYGVRQAVLDLNWTRSTLAAQAIQARCIEKFKTPVWLIDITEHSSENFLVERGDYVVFDCDFLRDEDGLPLRAQIGRVLDIDKDMDTLSVGFQIQVIGKFYPTSPITYNGQHTYGDGTTFGGTRAREVTS